MWHRGRMLVPIRRSLASVVAWVVGAAIAVAVGLLALSLIGDGLITGTGRSTTSHEDDPSGVAAGPFPPSPSSTAAGPGMSAQGLPVPVPPGGTRGATTPGATPTATDTGGTRLFSAVGGTALARCTPSGAYLVSWSPAQDYSVADVQRGPASTVDVRFVGGSRDSEIAVRCGGDGVPQAVGWQGAYHTGDR